MKNIVLSSRELELLDGILTKEIIRVLGEISYHFYECECFREIYADKYNELRAIQDKIRL